MLYSGDQQTVFIKFYWNTAAVFHVCFAYSCFHAATAELNSYWTEALWSTKPKVLAIWPPTDICQPLIQRL